MAIADMFARRGRSTAPAPATAQVPRQSVGARLQELLTLADAQDADAGRDAWLAQAVEHLVPDEAKILGVLADYPDGAPGCALMHIHCLSGTGIAGEALLENASLVGKAAGVSLPELTPSYVQRLLLDDLVEIGPEDPRLHDEYHSLLADSTVLAALGRARNDGFTPRVIRHTLRLAPLGRALWQSIAPA